MRKTGFVARNQFESSLAYQRLIGILGTEDTSRGRGDFSFDGSEELVF